MEEKAAALAAAEAEAAVTGFDGQGTQGVAKVLPGAVTAAPAAVTVQRFRALAPLQPVAEGGESGCLSKVILPPEAGLPSGVKLKPGAGEDATLAVELDAQVATSAGVYLEPASQYE